MKKILTILTFLFISAGSIYSQGFDWQYSSRLPFYYPYLFAGLSGSMGYLQHSGNLALSEGAGDCCNFSSGLGLGSNIGLRAEYWIDGLWAANVNASYVVHQGDFSAPGYDLPFSVLDAGGRVIGHDTATFSNDMNSVINYIALDFGVKRRLFSSHFFAGLSIETGYMISNSITQTEKVVSPSYFRYNDGSQQRTLGTYEMTDLSKILFIPKISLGYDLPLGLDLYTTPFLSVGFPVQDIAKTGNWNTWNFSFGISIMRSVAFR